MFNLFGPVSMSEAMGFEPGIDPAYKLNPDHSLSAVEDEYEIENLLKDIKTRTINKTIFKRYQSQYYEISTVFLVYAHTFNQDVKNKYLFETMVFAGPDSNESLDELMRRYQTYEDAAVGHLEIVAKIKELYSF